jgi:nitroreductase
VKEAAMEFNEVLFSRRSVREYTSQLVDEQAIRHLIEASIYAPNAVNQQPWTFTVVREQAMLDRISREAKAHMLANMPASDHSEHFRSLLGDPKFQIFYHAPVLIVISGIRQGPWIVEDCALAAQNLMLAAYAAGLGSCWIGFAQNFLNSPEGKQLLDLPAVSVPVAPIIVGRPKSIPVDVPRKTPDINWI